MHNAYRSGTADVWYSGRAGDLWIEYKFIRELPVHAPIRITTLCSKQQLLWLNGRHAEGRHVAVVLGHTAYAWIYEGGAWNIDDVTGLMMIKRGLDRQAVADFIRRKTMVP
jgi:hypothetical protein